MKLYTFLNDDDEVIAEVRAENHDEALERANAWRPEHETIQFMNDFYSTPIEAEGWS